MNKHQTNRFIKYRYLILNHGNGMETAIVGVEGTKWRGGASLRSGVIKKNWARVADPRHRGACLHNGSGKF